MRFGRRKGKEGGEGRKEKRGSGEWRVGEGREGKGDDDDDDDEDAVGHTK